MKQLVNHDSILVYIVLNTDIFDDTLRWKSRSNLFLELTSTKHLGSIII